MNSIYKIIDIIEKNTEVYNMIKFCPYEILKKLDIKEYKKGDIIINQGEIFGKFCMVTYGQLDIYIMAENGKKYSQALYEKGDYIGELEIFEDKPSSCFVKALSNVTLIELDKDDFFKWMDLDKNISSYITKTLCSLFYELSQKSGSDTLYSLKQRLCKYLIKCAEKNQGIKLLVKKDNLSEQMAVTQRSINRILQYLKNKEIIDEEDGGIIIKNFEALKQEEEISRYE